MPELPSRFHCVVVSPSASGTCAGTGVGDTVPIELLAVQGAEGTGIDLYQWVQEMSQIRTPCEGPVDYHVQPWRVRDRLSHSAVYR